MRPDAPTHHRVDTNLAITMVCDMLLVAMMMMMMMVMMMMMMMMMVTFNNA